MEISYVGTDFWGWQSQPHGNTVQDHIEAALCPLLGEKVRLIGASRTDSGVHAEQQFAVFRTKAVKFFSTEFLDLLNASLSAKVKVKRLGAVAPDFHPSVDAAEKRYRYQIMEDPAPTSHAYPFHWRIYRSLSAEDLRSELQKLVGEFDFTSFCAGDARVLQRTRRILAIEVVKREKEIFLTFRGEGFLKQMIRIIVGTAVEFVSSEHPTRDLLEVLAERDRRKAGRTAPAQGLSLESIHYSKPIFDPQLLWVSRET